MRKIANETDDRSEAQTTPVLPNGQPGASQSPDLTYEEAYSQLEQVLQTLESGDLPLEDSLSLYELGATLAAFCARTLDAAELRVRQWQPGDQTTTFEEWQEG